MVFNFDIIDKEGVIARYVPGAMDKETMKNLVEGGIIKYKGAVTQIFEVKCNSSFLLKFLYLIFIK